MKSITTRPDSSQSVADTAVYLFDDWFDPIEAAVRDRVRGFIQAMVEGELDATLLRPRYGRRPTSSDSNKDGLVAVIGHRHGHRTRSLTGTFGRTEIAVPRARLVGGWHIGGRPFGGPKSLIRSNCGQWLRIKGNGADSVIGLFSASYSFGLFVSLQPAPIRLGQLEHI